MSGWTGGLRPELVPWFQWIVAYVQYYDSQAQVTSGYRSSGEQAKLYRRYLQGLMPGPVAPPGQSMHEQGRAIDIYDNAWDATFDPANPPEALAQAGAAWQSVGGTWGGAFQSVAPDPIHFEA